jgi:hypothetical protein
VVSEDKFACLGAIIQNDNGKRYIMRGYTGNMKGTKIPDNMVVKPINGRYFTQQDGEDWVMKSTDTYAQHTEYVRRAQAVDLLACIVNSAIKRSGTTSVHGF